MEGGFCRQLSAGFVSVHYSLKLLTNFSFLPFQFFTESFALRYSAFRCPSTCIGGVGNFIIQTEQWLHNHYRTRRPLKASTIYSTAIYTRSMPRSKSRYDARHESPYTNEKKSKEPSLLDQIFCFGDDLIDMIDQLVLDSYAETVTSSVGEEDSRIDDGIDTVLEKYEKFIRPKEKKDETRVDYSVGGDESAAREDIDGVSPRLKRPVKQNHARAKPEDDYLHQIRRKKEIAIAGDLYEM